ncbi:hypothetical protein GQX74_008907 [Glossina fuscipes]|nr:hypothetical protein GQX74_008907 [Glossina fuscipes]
MTYHIGDGIEWTTKLPQDVLAAVTPRKSKLPNLLPLGRDSFRFKPGKLSKCNQTYQINEPTKKTGREKKSSHIIKVKPYSTSYVVCFHTCCKVFRRLNFGISNGKSLRSCGRPILLVLIVLTAVISPLLTLSVDGKFNFGNVNFCKPIKGLPSSRECNDMPLSEPRISSVNCISVLLAGGLRFFKASI